MSDAQIAYAIQKLKETKVLDGGDAATGGIGIMTGGAMEETYDFLVAARMLKSKDRMAKGVHRAILSRI